MIIPRPTLRSCACLLLWVPLTLVLSGCGGGGGGGGDDEPVAVGTTTTTVTPPSAASYSPQAGGFPALAQTPDNLSAMSSCASDTVALPPAAPAGHIYGRVRFERVPPFPEVSPQQGLDYGSTRLEPARGVVVEAVDGTGGTCSDTVLDTTLTDGQGEYLLSGLDDSRPVCVRVRAQLYGGAATGAVWDVQVTDNTAGNAPYYLLENPPATPVDRRQRDLTAEMGGSEVFFTGYERPRAAAPFAILDSTCTTFNRLIAADPSIILPELFIRWSTQNQPVDGNLAEGEIGGAFFRQFRNPLINELFLSGFEDVDTDEYDQHVVIHELGHYFSANVVDRIDSLGGPHALGELLDFTVAYEEGWADAFAGMMLDEAGADGRFYIDTFGSRQNAAIYIDLAEGRYGQPGWYNESSVYRIFYNLYDNVNSIADGPDEVALDFDPLYAVLTGAHAHSDAFLSIFSFASELVRRESGLAEEINALVFQEDIATNHQGNPGAPIDPFAEGEPNSAGIGYPDPVYSTLTTATPVSNLCSSDRFGVQNKLYNFRYVRFTAAAGVDRYRFTVDGTVNAGVELWDRGLFRVPITRSEGVGTVQAEYELAGIQDYVLVIYYEDNVVDDGANPGDRCFTISVQAV